MMSDIFICRTDYLALIDKFFQPVCAPSCDTRNSKYRSEHLLRYSKHCIYKSAVEIDIRTYRLQCVAGLGYKFLSYSLNPVIKLKLFDKTLLLRQTLGIFLKNNLTRV